MPASVSSFVSTPDSAEGKDPKKASDPDTDDVNIDSTKASTINGVFGVLYTVTKEKDTQSIGFALFRLVADFLQLFLLLVNPNYGYDIKYYSKGWEVVSFIGLNQFFAARGYTFFLIFFYVFVVMLLLVCATCFWVAWSFQNNRFDQVWPIIFLKLFSNVFFQVLDVASLSMFLITLDCNYFDVPDNQRNTNVEFPDIKCWSMPHLAHVMVSATSLVVFVCLASLVNMAEIELNPVSKNPMAMGHSKVELVGFLVRMAMTMVNTFVTNRKWMSIIQLLLSWALVWQYTVWIPHMTAVTNYLRSASYAIVFYCSILTVLLSFKPGVDTFHEEEVYQYKQKITIALWVGMPIAAVAGGAAAFARTCFFSKWVLSRFRNAPLGTKPKAIYTFTDPREVEIVARCCRKWVGEDVLDAEAVKLAELVIKAGLAELPTEAYMIILYSSFLIDVQGSYQSGYSQLQAAQKLESCLLERFAVFSREQQHTQKAAGGKGAQDLVSYVEFQRNYSLALSVHREALLAERAFWRCLMKHKVTFATLSRAVVRIDRAIMNAERVYRTVLQRHQGSWKLLKLYVRFLELVKNDPWSAAKWNTQAEILQQAEEEARNDVFGELERNAGDDDDEGVKKAKEIRAQLDDSRAVIIINAKGEITLTNQAASEILGHSKGDMRGQNIKLIIPSPFSDHHDSYLRKYALTSKANILGLTREFVALHKERYVLAVVLTVSQIRGSGEDASFMGVIEPVPHTDNTAKAWFMTSGAIVSVDAYFQDWFGYRNEDLLGTFVSSLVVEHKQLSEFLKRVKEASHAEKQMFVDGAGRSHVEKEWEINGLHIKHKFTESIAVDMSIRQGGAGNHSFYVMTVRRQSTHQDHMLVCDTRGRVQHCTQELAAMLGYTPHSIMANGASNAVEAIIPQPYSQLHRKHIADGLPPLASPHSCISGIAVCLKSISSDGPPMTPFKLKLQQRDESGSSHRVITFKKMTTPEALDERRMSVLVNPSGKITSVSNSPPHLFGFDPMSMLGQPISRYIDGLRPAGGASAGVPLPEDPELRAMALDTDNQELEHLIMQLAKRATEVPGCSWRVGVAAPIDDVEMASLGGLAQHFIHQRTKAAVMTVNIRISGALATRRRSMIRTSTLNGRHSSIGAPSLGASERACVEGLLERQSIQGGGTELSGRRLPSSKRASTMMLELNLWRADLMAGIMEIDSRGKIVNVKEHQLNPPGLLFGMPNDKLLHKHVSRVLPLGDRPVSDLFKAEFGGGAIRSKLKKSAKHADGRLLKPGKVNVIATRHFMDMATLELQVQAVYKWGTSGHAYILMHPMRPRMAPVNFRDLISQDLDQATVSGKQLESIAPTMNVWPVKAPPGIRESGQAPEPSGSSPTKGVRMAPGLISGPSGRGADPSGRGPEPSGRGRSMQLQSVPEGNTVPGNEVLGPGGAGAPGGGGAQSVLSNDAADQLMLDLGAPGATGAGVGSKGVERSGSLQQVGSASMMVKVRQDSFQQSGGASTATKARQDSFQQKSFSFTGITSDPALLSGTVQQSSLMERFHLDSQPTEDDGGGFDGEGDGDDPRTDVAYDGEPMAVAMQPALLDSGSAGCDDDRSGDDAGSAGARAPAGINDHTDYRRGQRFKKILGLLSATNGARIMRKFKNRTLAVVGIIVLLNIATFVTMLVLITDQKQQVDQLNAIGFTARAIADVLVHTRAVEIVLSNLTQPHLLRLNDSSALQYTLAQLWDATRAFLDGHSGIFLGHGSQRRMPDSLSVRPKWASPINNVTVYSLAEDGSNLTSRIEKASLWDIGNRLGKAALNVWQNAVNQSSGSINPADISSISVEADRAFILDNGPNVLHAGYFATLDAYVDMVISNSTIINNTQLILMLVEGCVIAICVILFMWTITSRLAYHRHTLYNVFMLVPIGLIRGLATKEIVVEGKEADNAIEAGLEGDVAPPEEEEAGGKEQQGVAGGGIKFSTFGQVALQGPPRPLVTRVLSKLMWWRPKARVAPVASKRQLERSYGMAIWLTWPFAMWGIMIIAINAAGLKNMHNIETAIAIFNMINFVNTRYHRVLFYMQELCRDTNPVTREIKRADQLSRWRLFDTEYRGLMYGHEAVPNETSVHFVRATNGLVTYGPHTTTLMFNDRNCLAEDPADCLPEGDPYYEVTRNGLDLMIRHALEQILLVYYSAGDEPNLASDPYAYVWNTFPNVVGGLSQANALVQQAVNQVYGSVVRVHVLALLLTCCIMAAYLLFILRRYMKETNGETKRIAELLTQLGADVDMEGMLKAVLFTGDDSVRGKAKRSGSGRLEGDEESGLASVDTHGRSLALGGTNSGSMARYGSIPPNMTMTIMRANPQQMNGLAAKVGVGAEGMGSWQARSQGMNGATGMGLGNGAAMTAVAYGNGGYDTKGALNGAGYGQGLDGASKGVRRGMQGLMMGALEDEDFNPATTTTTSKRSKAKGGAGKKKVHRGDRLS